MEVDVLPRLASIARSPQQHNNQTRGLLGAWDGKYGIRDNYKLIISVFAAWRL